ncbi:hypothetical protein B0G82_7452 [Paraburkholderia sp. BL17N1]|nr:hypothetical protein B0G82_7452 [Paraburkholderia sp. BL17N1]
MCPRGGLDERQVGAFMNIVEAPPNTDFRDRKTTRRYLLYRTRPLSLERIWFAFPVQLWVLRGQLRSRRSSHGTKLVRISRTKVPELDRFDIDADPDVTGAVCVAIEPDLSGVTNVWEAQLRASLNDKISTKSVTRALAAAVFLHPHLDWRILTVAMRSGVSGEHLQQRLRFEGYSFSEVVRFQIKMAHLFTCS